MHWQQILYTAVCYIPLAIFLFTTVLITPALAFFPSLIRSPLLATSIPIISILIVNTIGILLFTFDLYHHPVVLPITILLFFIAVFRVPGYRGQAAVRRSCHDNLYLLLINIGILLPLIAFCGLSSFRSNDALASWNYWAMHYYHGETPYTMGYPPFFSIFISYCYQVLGNTDYQGVVKTLLVVFPLTMMNAIAFASRETKNCILFYLIIISICIFPGFLKFNFYSFYALGYADPMLAASIVTSFMLLLKYLATPARKDYLFFAVLCGIVASLSKQPGLLWCYFAFPALILTKWMAQKKIDQWDLSALLLLFLPAGIWLLGAGSRFYDNEGVMMASIKQDHVTLSALFKSLAGSFVEYFLLQPTLLFIFILTIIACRQSIYRIISLLIFIIPGFILWFTLGSYHVRLGLYLLACCGLLIAADNYLIHRGWVKWVIAKSHYYLSITPKKFAYCFVTVGIFVFVVESFTRQINMHNFTSEHVYPFNAGLTNCYHFFDNQAEFIYQNIFRNKSIKIYSAERYTSAIFYGNTHITPLPRELTEKGVLDNLKTYQPDYVFASFCSKEDYADCKVIQKIAKKHPGLLIPVPMQNAKWDVRLYVLDKNML